MWRLQTTHKLQTGAESAAPVYIGNTVMSWLTAWFGLLSIMRSHNNV